MAEAAWQKLIIKYADGKPICNCRDAYYWPVGEGIDKDGKHRTDMLACRHGCSSNKIDAKNYVAFRIEND